jgi:hypothetical protein
MKNAIELLRAISTLLWPIFAFWLFFTYKEEIRSLLRRIKKGKLFGQEIELEDSLQRLQEAAKKAATEVAPAEEFRLQENKHAFIEDASDPVDKILEEATRSPKAALLLLASECEKEVRRLLVSTGWHRGRQIRSIRQGFDILSQLEVLPPNVASSVRLFADIRNRLIHGQDATDDDTLRAIDSGITILKVLKAIPHETNIVYHPCVELFSDPEGKNRVPNVCGLILETTSPGGTTKQHRIFPTTRNDYQRSRRVSWEWNSKNTYGPTWYKDPDTGEIKQAWLDSTEFIGRDLDEV